MEQFIVLAFLCGLSFIGLKILDRLPKERSHRDFTFELPEMHVAFKVEVLIEDDFEVAYIDDWELGRSFSFYGPVIINDDGDDKPKLDLDFGERTGVKVVPNANWFERSRIGYVRVFVNGGCEMVVALPYQIARHMLEDIRREPNQIAVVGIKANTEKNGKSTYGIYSLELRESSD